MKKSESFKSPVKPIFLFADSQILFWQGQDGLVLERIKRLIREEHPRKRIKAAYIGASNEDNRDYYEIFLAAVSQVGIKPGRCMMIKSKPSKDERAFLNKADIVLLAGGDAWKGWTIMSDNGVREKIVERYHNGAVLIGVSAGAVQLGSRGWLDDEGAYDPGKIFTALQLVPFVIDVHEKDQWDRLHETVGNGEEHCRGFGIPAGGGAVFHPDWSMEAIRHPLAEFSLFPEELKHSMIFPPGPGTEEDQEEKRGTRD